MWPPPPTPVSVCVFFQPQSDYWASCLTSEMPVALPRPPPAHVRCCDSVHARASSGHGTQSDLTFSQGLDTDEYFIVRLLTGHNDLVFAKKPKPKTYLIF